MANKLDILASILTNLFTTSYTQNIIPYGQDGITTLNGVSIDNSGDYLRGIILHSKSIKTGNAWKEFTHDLVIECNSEDILDAAIKELEDYSFDHPDPTYKYIPFPPFVSYEYTDLLSFSSYAIIYGAGDPSVYNNTNPVYISSANGANQNVGFFCIPITATTKKVRFNIYNGSNGALTDTTIYYKTSTTSITPSSSNFADLKTEMEAADSFTQLLTGYPENSVDEVTIEFNKLGVDGYLYVMFHTLNETITHGLYINIAAQSTLEVIDYETDYTPSLDQLPYFIKIIEKERSVDETNPNAILNITARYEK